MYGGTVRNVWTGLGAYYGALAFRLAASGAEPEPGLLAQLYDGAVTTGADTEEIAGEPGRRWRVVDSYLKPYACARWIHPALDALGAALVEAGSPEPSDIVEIVVESFAFAASLDSAGDESDLHARFSVPRCAASLVVDGRLDASGFLPDRFERPAVIETTAKVRMVEVPEFTAALPAERPARVTLRTRTGSVTRSVRNARGNPSDPLSLAEVEEKFRGNVGPLLPAAAIDPVVDRLTIATTSGGSSLRSLALAIVEVL
jgi:2-methylcitrate dehydratase PrpD